LGIVSIILKWFQLPLLLLVFIIIIIIILYCYYYHSMALQLLLGPLTPNYMNFETSEFLRVDIGSPISYIQPGGPGYRLFPASRSKPHCRGWP
jgi:hypothetical protein